MWCRWSLRVDVLCQSVAVFKAILYTVSKKKRCHWFFCCDVYKYWRIFIIFLCTTSQENDKVIGIKIYHHTFVMLLPYRVKVSDTKVTHFTTILALCTCLYRLHLRKPVSMKQTKHSRKSVAQNLCSKCPPFTRTHAYATPLCNRWWFRWQCPVLVLRSCTSWNQVTRVKVNGEYYRNTVLLNMLMLDIRSVFWNYYVF